MSCPSLLPPLCRYSSSWLLQPLLLHQGLSPQASEDPHKQLPWFAGFCQVIWSKSPQVVTHTHTQTLACAAHTPHPGHLFLAQLQQAANEKTLETACAGQDVMRGGRKQLLRPSTEIPSLGWCKVQQTSPISHSFHPNRQDAGGPGLQRDLWILQQTQPSKTACCSMIQSLMGQICL